MVQRGVPPSLPRRHGSLLGPDYECLTSSEGQRRAICCPPIEVGLGGTSTCSVLDPQSKLSNRGMRTVYIVRCMSIINALCSVVD